MTENNEQYVPPLRPQDEINPLEKRISELEAMLKVLFHLTGHAEHPDAPK